MSLRVVAWVGALAVTIGWWLSSSAGPGTVRSVAPPGQDRPALAAGATSQFTERLHRELRNTPPRPAPRRNPFLFASRGAIAPNSAVQIPVYTPPVAVETAPAAMTLAGVATTTTPEGVIRTAVISGRGQVWLVKAGEAGPMNLQVLRVEENLVVLTDAAGAETILRLK